MPNAPVDHRARRSPRQLAVRGGLAVLILLLGHTSTTRTLAIVVARTDPERAYQLAPGDGRVAAKLAEQLVTRQGGAAQRARATRLARQALGDEPLAASALTALALNTQLGGDTAQARRLFIHSDALSRRELGTRLWLIEDAVGRGDVTGALRHYDIALRTASGASDLLYPVLSNAIADPAIATALARRIATRPPWSNSFIGYLSVLSKTPDVSALFLRRLPEFGVSVPEAAQISAVNALVAAGKMIDAWTYYASIRKGVSRDQSRDPLFSARFVTPAAFDWMPVTSDDGISGSIQAGLFDFSAPPSVGGVALQQTELLPPGRYRLFGISAGIEQSSGTTPYWQLSCSGTYDAGRVEIPNSTINNGRFEGELPIGTDCPVQTLKLIIRPSSGIEGVTGQIKRVQLVPVG